MEIISFRVIRDSFTVKGFAEVESVMLFNNGMSFVNVEESRAVKAGYGIRLRYLDECGVRKCVNEYGTVMFFGIDETTDCSQLTVSTGEDVTYESCGNFIQIRAKIALKSHNVDNNT